MMRSFKAFSSATDRVIDACKRGLSLVLPYRPMDGGKKLLDAEYATGVWEYLGELEELSRFCIIAGYCHYLLSGIALQAFFQ